MVQVPWALQKGGGGGQGAGGGGGGWGGMRETGLLGCCQLVASTCRGRGGEEGVLSGCWALLHGRAERVLYSPQTLEAVHVKAHMLCQCTYRKTFAVASTKIDLLQPGLTIYLLHSFPPSLQAFWCAIASGSTLLRTLIARSSQDGMCR